MIKDCQKVLGKLRKQVEKKGEEERKIGKISRGDEETGKENEIT